MLTAAELAEVSAAMWDAGEYVEGLLHADVIAGGRSNLTAIIEDERGSRWVLRMPPRVGRTPSAHDVAREFQVTSALRGTGVPVARPVVLCREERHLDGPFTVVDFVQGATIRTQADLAELADSEVATAVTSMSRSLAILHSLDHEALGLAEFGRSDGYAERQLRRWSGQWERVGAPELNGLAREVIRVLGARLPRQVRSSVVHGDYRIDNVLLSSDAEVAAVVDWELSTIGDPVADLAMTCAYRDSAFDSIVGESAASTSERLPTSEELAQRYLDEGGVELVDWELHLALAHFKVAVIAAGIDYRRRTGGASGCGFDTSREAVHPYLARALGLARSA